MKKVVIIILAILPIFLIISISFAAKWISLYQHIEVESVAFVDENNIEYKENFIFKLNVGEEKATRIKILPELASNKKVEYSSTNKDICTIDENGVVTGIAFGSAIVIVKTEENDLYSMLIVKVEEKRVTGIEFPETEIELTVGETKQMKAIIIPDGAEDRLVEYSSSNPEIVTIDPNGNVKAIKEGEATIYAKSHDGGFVAECSVICNPGIPAIDFDLTSYSQFVKQGDGYIVKFVEPIQINLKNCLQIDEKKVIIEEIRFKVFEGEGIIQFNKETGDLTITNNGTIITILAYVGELSNPTYQAELMIMVQ